MLECKLGLNDRVLLEALGRTTKGKAIDLDDNKFHQYVRLARFENDRTISFITPDGAFDLMTYRLSTQVKPLIWVEAQVERHFKCRIEMMVKARSQYKERRVASSWHATNPNERTSMGSSSYVLEKDALVWKIKSFPSGKEYMLRVEFLSSSASSSFLFQLFPGSPMLKPGWRNSVIKWSQISRDQPDLLEVLLFSAAKTLKLVKV